jgi:hypothetical protein
MFAPTLTMPEMIFLGLVLAAFAAFAIALSSVHLYVTLPPRRRRAAAPARVVAPPRRHHAVSA